MTMKQLVKMAKRIKGMEIDKYDFEDTIISLFETENKVIIDKSGSNFNNFIIYVETDNKYIELELEVQEETIKIVEAYIKNFRE